MPPLQALCRAFHATTAQSAEENTPATQPCRLPAAPQRQALSGSGRRQQSRAGHAVRTRTAFCRCRFGARALGRSAAGFTAPRRGESEPPLSHPRAARRSTRSHNAPRIAPTRRLALETAPLSEENRRRERLPRASSRTRARRQRPAGELSRQPQQVDGRGPAPLRAAAQAGPAERLPGQEDGRGIEQSQPAGDGRENARSVPRSPPPRGPPFTRPAARNRTRPREAAGRRNGDHLTPTTPTSSLERRRSVRAFSPKAAARNSTCGGSGAGSAAGGPGRPPGRR